MKKLFELSLAVMMLFTLVACGNVNRAETDTPQPQNSSPASAEGTTAENKGPSVPSKGRDRG